MDDSNRTPNDYRNCRGVLSPLEDIFDECVQFIENHKDEMSEYSGTLDMDYISYKMAAPQFVALVLRDCDRMVGLSLFLICSDLRDKTSTQATNHGLFLIKPYRGKFGLWMIKESNRQLQNLGISEILYINDSHVFGRLLKRFGFIPKYTIWSIHGQQRR